MDINLPDGTVYSKRKGYDTFSVPPLEEYIRVVGPQKIEHLFEISNQLKGLKLLDVNATTNGGGVAEMLYSAIPFINQLGIENEWRTISGSKEYFECTKSLHNMLQGMEIALTPEMVKTYCTNIAENVSSNLTENNPDLVLIHDPQPAALSYHLKKTGQIWVWRCHIDIDEEVFNTNIGLRDFMSNWLKNYDAAVFTAAHYVITQWALPKFIIPPFIDPLSEKNRDLTQEEINNVLDKYEIDRSTPIIAQIGRFDPWKGLDTTIAAYQIAKKERRCQLVLAGGMASDDPEGERILTKIYEKVKYDSDIHVLNLQMTDRLENWREVNALQRAADIIMQPSIKEGFGLVITEALWKQKPVIATNVGAISFQIKDGETGFFINSDQEAAQTLIYLLDNPDTGIAVGQQGKQYVLEHFLMPDRIADWLMSANMLIGGQLNKQTCKECIISYHPWFKLSKRKHFNIA